MPRPDSARLWYEKVEHPAWKVWRALADVVLDETTVDTPIGPVTRSHADIAAVDVSQAQTALTDIVRHLRSLA